MKALLTRLLIIVASFVVAAIILLALTAGDLAFVFDHLGQGERQRWEDFQLGVAVLGVGIAYAALRYWYREARRQGSTDKWEFIRHGRRVADPDLPDPRSNAEDFKGRRGESSTGSD